MKLLKIWVEADVGKDGERPASASDQSESETKEAYHTYTLLISVEIWLFRTSADGAGYVAPISRACSRSSFALPYIWRLMSFRRVI